jgi:hypothetical protein
MSGFKSLPPEDGATLREPGAGDRPLGMTVHSVPAPDLQVMDQNARTRKGRITLVLMFLAVMSPVIASYFTYYVLRPEGRRNYGTLIDPQRPMPAVSGVDAEGKPLALAALRHQWLLISVADTACNAECEQHLYLSRQLRESLGKDKDRLDWVWLHTGSEPIPERLRQGLSAGKVLRMDRGELGRWLEPESGHALENHLYLVDPMGNWMMRFPAKVDAAKARRDMERLLRASSSWDTAGRPS